ncbi:unnamed protein product (mitochondrion) [Plasmodiophora brassicae]|uniref:Zinc-finger domain-containing protein n=2 Tax=Plasmodiophora brassicae TaxID=37360 RepID=A0A3P3YJN7_PLABS|nr:unnamed protein product [Plasmodiophora brassicae]
MPPVGVAHARSATARSVWCSHHSGRDPVTIGARPNAENIIGNAAARASYLGSSSSGPGMQLVGDNAMKTSVGFNIRTPTLQPVPAASTGGRPASACFSPSIFLDGPNGDPIADICLPKVPDDVPERSLLSRYRRSTTDDVLLSLLERQDDVAAPSDASMASAGPPGLQEASLDDMFRDMSPSPMSRLRPDSMFDSEASLPGSSCHQCKNRRMPNELSFCCADATDEASGSCRKKYCDICLQKFYGEPRDDQERDVERLPWPCPSCRSICTCAACRRNKVKRPVPEHLLQSTSPATLYAVSLVYFGQDITAPVASELMNLATPEPITGRKRPLQQLDKQKKSAPRSKKHCPFDKSPPPTDLSRLGPEEADEVVVLQGLRAAAESASAIHAL